MFLGMQAALYYHATTVAIAAAQEGARAAGAEQGRESDGVGAANDFLDEAGGDDVLTGTSTSANRTATTATVTVTGFSLSVIPGLEGPDHAERDACPSRQVTRDHDPPGRARFGGDRGGDRRTRLRPVRRPDHLRRAYGDHP